MWLHHCLGFCTCSALFARDTCLVQSSSPSDALLSRKSLQNFCHSQADKVIFGKQPQADHVLYIGGMFPLVLWLAPQANDARLLLRWQAPDSQPDVQALWAWLQLQLATALLHSRPKAAQPVCVDMDGPGGSVLAVEDSQAVLADDTGLVEAMQFWELLDVLIETGHGRAVTVMLVRIYELLRAGDAFRCGSRGLCKPVWITSSPPRPLNHESESAQGKSWLLPPCLNGALYPLALVGCRIRAELRPLVKLSMALF